MAKVNRKFIDEVGSRFNASACMSCGACTAICPMETGIAGGMDSLLSMVQMPRGVPVATMGTGKSGAINAAILAAQIIALDDAALRGRLRLFKSEMAEKVVQTSEDVRRRLRLT